MALHSRIQRVNEEIRSALAQAMMTELKDPRLTDVMITVNEVNTARDFSQAQVWVSVLADDKVSKGAVAALNQARGYLKREVAGRMALKMMPDLHFKLDETGRRAARIQELLTEVERKQARPGGPGKKTASEKS